jgi:hypothetical protein
MAVVVATPLGQAAVPDWVTLNPLFDQPAPILGALGIPWWFIIGCGVILFIILVIISWVFKFRRMAAVKGHKEIQKKAGPEDIEAWLFSKTQKMIIECLHIVGGVASYNNPLMISKWYLTSPMAMLHIGGYPAMMISDDYDRSRDPVSEVALCHACDEFNADLKEWDTRIRPGLEKSGQVLEGMDYHELAKPIESYSDYRSRGHLLLKLRYPDGIPIPAYSIFNPVKFRKYFPRGRDATFYGGVQIRKARKLQTRIKEKGFWEKTIPLMIIAAIIIIVNIAAWQVKFGPGA